MISSSESSSPPFGAGTPVPRSAKYAGIHQGHHLPFQMMHLFGGELFPRCPQCGDAVSYVEVLRSRRRDRASVSGRSGTPLHAV
jgi:hypothetical protein